MSVKGSSSGKTLIFLALTALVAGVVIQLYYFGFIGAKMPEPKKQRTGLNIEDISATTPSSVTPGNAQTPVTISKVQTTQPVASAEQRTAPAAKPQFNLASLEQEYKARFKALQPGTPFILKFKAGNSMQAVLQEIRLEKVMVTCNGAEITFEKADLSSHTLALLYPDDYAAYMLAMESRQSMDAYNKKNMPVPPSQPTPAVQAIPPQTSTPRTTTAPPPKTTSATKPAPTSGPRPSKKPSTSLAEQAQESDLLKARKQRVQEFEENAQKEGKVF